MSVVDVRDLNTIVREHNQVFQTVKSEIAKVIVGQESLVEGLLIALLADGHLLLEGLPGLAKTLAVSTLAKVLECDFKRIQFTPDLLPADLLGTTIYRAKDESFKVHKGPLFTNVVLADEINRAPAKVQSALLEVMAERQITIGSETFLSEDPFLVLATQNPVDQEGTYPLPEAQTDRFMMKIKVDYPSRADEKRILARMGSKRSSPIALPVMVKADILKAREIIDDIYVDEKVNEYILDIIFATRDPKKNCLAIDGLVDCGASPRASLALTAAAKARAFLDGRGFVTPHDIKMMAHNVLRHRLKLTYEAEAENMSSDMIIDKILDQLYVP